MRNHSTILSNVKAEKRYKRRNTLDTGFPGSREQWRLPKPVSLHKNE